MHTGDRQVSALEAVKAAAFVEEGVSLLNRPTFSASGVWRSNGVTRPRKQHCGSTKGTPDAVWRSKWFGGVSVVQHVLQRSVDVHSTRRFLTAQLVEAAGCVKALLHRWCLNFRSFVFSRTLAFRRLQSWSSGKSFLDAFVFIDNEYDVYFDDVAEVDWSWLSNEPVSEGETGLVSEVKTEPVSDVMELALDEVEEAYPSVITDVYHAKQFRVLTVLSMV